MLELKQISKDYYVDKKPFRALSDVNLYFTSNEFCSILGPSGCGKSTLLNIIGGLDKYTTGDLIIDGKSTKTYEDKDWDNYRNKRIGFIFQSYNLISHLTILGNVEMALTLDGVSKKERLEKAKIALEKVGLKSALRKKPNQLSGGQMQRVAIARALVNDPEIILADEPTGALDSATSVQVMDLLKSISKEKLVIMVTHNKELAYKYSSRIIELKDGKIINDTNPKVAPKKEEKKTEEIKDIKLEIIDEKSKTKNKKATKLKKTKKEKTQMGFFTALNISFKNLLTKKTRTMLTSVAASFGIIGVALVLALSNGFTEYINKIEVETASSMPVMISSYSITYEKNPDAITPEKFPETKEIYPYISNKGAAVYKYNNFNEKYLNYLTYLRDNKKIMNDFIVNYGEQYSFNLLTNDYDGSVKYVNNKTISSFNSIVNSVTGLPTTMFHVLYGQEEYVTKNYDIIDGRYPENKNELVIVCDQYNRVNPTILKELGFYSSQTTAVEMNEKPVSFEDLYNKKFKIFFNDTYYSKASENTITDNLYHSRTVDVYSDNDQTNIFNDSTKGMELKIVGILRPSKSSTLSLMAEGLCYTPELQDYFTKTNSTAQMYDSMKTNYAFNKSDSNGNKYTIFDFFTALLNLFSKDSVSVNGLNLLFDQYFTFYNFETGLPFEATETKTATLQYLKSCESKGIDLITEELKTNGLSNIASYLGKIQANLLLTSSYEKGYEDLLGLIAYINSYSNIVSIIVFPKDLTSKNALLSLLDEYNNVNILNPNDKYHATSNSECIFYTDFVGELTVGLTQMINVISIVLIIFASISLLVSCVMTGIITYVSVVERTKEIGVLRALGARKKDVGRLFEAESCIIGGLAGIIGCLFAFLLCFPLNLILNSIYAEYNLGSIASLSIIHCVVLTAISILLTFFSGLLPARMAARKDPVIALRTE